MSVEYITSKNLFMLICDSLRLVDKDLMEHGTRVSYILYRMLCCKGGYEEFELADFMLLAMLHDVGAYKTDKITKERTFDKQKMMPHSIYGYLFLKYLSHMDDTAKVVLYHHLSAKQLVNSKYEYKELAEYICLAEDVDAHPTLLKPEVGAKYTQGAYELFEEAIGKYDIMKKLSDGSYLKECDHMLEYVLFSDEEKEKYLQMLMYCTGMRNKHVAKDTITTISIARVLGKYLNLGEIEQKELYYAALLHDLGMLAFPKELLEKEDALTKEELALVKTHVQITRDLLKDRFNENIVEAACSHHERLDGSGYPEKKKGIMMTLQEEILQVADFVSALSRKRPYREAKSKTDIIKILREEAGTERLQRDVVNFLIVNYDSIMEYAAKRAATCQLMYQRLDTQFEEVYKKFTN